MDKLRVWPQSIEFRKLSENSSKCVERYYSAYRFDEATIRWGEKARPSRIIKNVPRLFLIKRRKTPAHRLVKLKYKIYVLAL